MVPAPHPRPLGSRPQGPEPWRPEGSAGEAEPLENPFSAFLAQAGTGRGLPLSL